MDYALEPCPHCRLENARLKRFDDVNTEGNCLVAVLCSGCGARGPVRYIAPGASVDAVMALASDDWNMTWHEGQIEYKVENTTVRIEALDDVLAAKESESELAIGSQDTTEGPTVDPEIKSPPESPSQAEGASRPDPASNGADRGGPQDATLSVSSPSNEAAKIDTAKASRAPDGSHRHPIAERIEAYLQRTDQSVWSGLFSVSDQTVHNILHGSTPKTPTVKKLVKELDQLERDEVLANQPIDESKIEALPNNYDKLKSGNPLPKYEAPARCARTP